MNTQLTRLLGHVLVDHLQTTNQAPQGPHPHPHPTAAQADQYGVEETDNVVPASVCGALCTRSIVLMFT